MVYVKLLCDVAEGGQKISKAYPTLKSTIKNGVVTWYTKDRVVTMHEAGAEKWVKRGLCEIVDKPEA